jgi:hypothetical protein
MGYAEFTREILVEWDILAAASHSCLAGRASGFIEREVILQTPASMTWRLWTKDLGEFGTFEVRKIRAGVSQIHFSGFGSTIDLSKEQRETKKRHMKNVIDLYFFLLSQENIVADDAPFVEEKAAVKENKLPPIYAEDLEMVKNLSLIPLTVDQIVARTGFSKSKVVRHRKTLNLQRHKKRPENDA